VDVEEAHEEVAAAVHHEDEVASATEVDVVAPADSVVAVEEAAASQEVEAVVSLPVVAVVVASVDVDVEVTKRDVLRAIRFAPSSNKRRSSLPCSGLFRLSRLLPADTTIIIRRRFGVKMGAM
jgi:hypothetical protein